jgi:hypothetical protein
VGPVLLEPLREPVALVHRSHSLDPFRHSSDGRNEADVTKEDQFMLGVKNYTQDYVDRCRSKVDSDLAAYRKISTAAKKQPAFEATLFNNMVLVLDHLFVHRLRTIEGKDGNPLNEVRILCDSIMINNSVVGADKTIKMDPERSVLKLQVGDTITLTEVQFTRLSKAFFDEIERKFQ